MRMTGIADHQAAKSLIAIAGPNSTVTTCKNSQIGKVCQVRRVVADWTAGKTTGAERHNR